MGYVGSGKDFKVAAAKVSKGWVAKECGGRVRKVALHAQECLRASNTEDEGGPFDNLKPSSGWLPAADRPEEDKVHQAGVEPGTHRWQECVLYKNNA